MYGFIHYYVWQNVLFFCFILSLMRFDKFARKVNQYNNTAWLALKYAPMNLESIYCRVLGWYLDFYRMPPLF